MSATTRTVFIILLGFVVLLGWKYVHRLSGLGKGSDERFVTPSVKGWVLAVGIPFLFEADDHQEKRITALSKEFGEAQFFASSAYLWARATDGKLVRLFYEGDGTRRIEGNETTEEKELNFKFFDSSSPESKEPGYWQRKDLTFVDEESVLNVADKWSVDPSELDRMGLTPAFGLLGSPSANYAPNPNWRHNR